MGTFLSPHPSLNYPAFSPQDYSDAFKKQNCGTADCPQPLNVSEEDREVINH